MQTTMEPRTLREKIARDKLERAADHDMFARVWREASAVARQAAADAIPEPMTVLNPATGQRWHVSEGACGFAWVNVRPATSRFARWLIAQKHATVNRYSGGVQIWISSYGQSVTRKEAYAAALARVLGRDLPARIAAGITYGSRLD